MTPTPPAFRNWCMRFEKLISGGSEISYVSVKLRDMLQIQVHGQKIIRLPTCRVRRFCRTRKRFPVKTFVEQIISKEEWNDPLLLYGRIIFSP